MVLDTFKKGWLYFGLDSTSRLALCYEVMALPLCNYLSNLPGEIESLGTYLPNSSDFQALLLFLLLLLLLFSISFVPNVGFELKTPEIKSHMLFGLSQPGAPLLLLF